MNLPTNVKVKKGLWKLFPFSKYTAQAIYPNIYVTRKVYKDLSSKKPSPHSVSVLLHEQKHIERQRKTGRIKWGLKYLFSSEFRLDEELSAIKEAARYLKKKNISFDTEKRAKFLSSWLYLWCISYDEAKRKLDRVWEEV